MAKPLRRIANDTNNDNNGPMAFINVAGFIMDGDADGMHLMLLHEDMLRIHFKS